MGFLLWLNDTRIFGLVNHTTVIYKTFRLASGQAVMSNLLVHVSSKKQP